MPHGKGEVIWPEQRKLWKDLRPFRKMDFGIPIGTDKFGSHADQSGQSTGQRKSDIPTARQIAVWNSCNGRD